VSDGDSAPPEKGVPKEIFGPCFCGQTTGWIKVALGTEVGLSPGDFVLDGNAAPPQKMGRSSQFFAHVYCGQTAGWTKMPLGMELGLGPGDFCVRWGPSNHWKKGTPTLSNFWPMSIVATRLDG